MVPTPGQCLHLDPEECHTAIKRRLGIDTSAGSQCSLSSDHSLGPLAHVPCNNMHVSEGVMLS